MELPSEQAWHNLQVGEVEAALEVDRDRGLSGQEARERLERLGPNRLTQKRGQSPFVRFLLQFNQPLVIILLAAAVITLLLAEYLDAAVIFAVVLVNSVIGFVQESKAMKAIESLAKSMTSEATVLRDGARRRIPAADLVPGDLVLLQSGDKVPADLRLDKIKELQIDESTLTGESVPVHKEQTDLDADTSIGDRRNMAYSSTLVTHGGGRGLVVATGDRTEIGRINELIASADILKTPLTEKIHHFSNKHIKFPYKIPAWPGIGCPVKFRSRKHGCVCNLS